MAGVATRIVTSALLLILPIVHLACAAERKKQPQQFVERLFDAPMLREAGRSRVFGDDPLAAAKTAEQRQFLTEYGRVEREQPYAWRRDQRYPIMEPLRRCGIGFPEGTTVVWLLNTNYLRVIHTPATMKQIEMYMGLTPAK